MLNVKSTIASLKKCGTWLMQSVLEMATTRYGKDLLILGAGNTLLMFMIGNIWWALLYAIAFLAGILWPEDGEKP